MALQLQIKVNSIPTMTAGLEGLLSQVVRKAAFDVEANAKANILTGEKTGHVYKRAGKTHQASAPGEAPANDTGNLANSINAEPISALLWQVRVSALYGVILELGGVFIAARPFLRPALDKVRPSLELAVKTVIEKAAQS